MQFVVPTVGEISLAHRLVCTQFEALVEVCGAAQDDGPPPDEPTLESLFISYDPIFPDHVAAAFQNAAQQQTRVCDVWAGSCHASVKTLADRVKLILRPDHEELRIEWRKSTPDETADDTPAYRQRTYFEACIPPESIDDIRDRWPELLSELKPIGVPDREAIDFSLTQESAQAVRDARDGEVRRALTSHSPPSRQEDGPVSPDGFRWNGTQSDGLKGKAWTLVAHLWSRPDKTSDDGSLTGTVWGDAEDVNANTVGSARREANRFFREMRIPWSIATRVHPEKTGWKLVTLTNQPPGQPKKKAPDKRKKTSKKRQSKKSPRPAR